MGKEPLRVDLLIIKKRPGAVIENEIGRIFRSYNVVEYKSPEDTLTIDDFYKTVSYACLYKSLGETVNQIPADELTVSVFHEKYPQKLMEELQRLRYTVREQFHGIYYVEGLAPLRAQIVVTSRLDAVHPSLRLLSKNARKEDALALLAQAAAFTTPGEQNNVSAVLEVSVSANENLYAEIRRDSPMYDALRKLMKEDLMQAKNEGRLEGKLEGKREGRLEGKLEGRLEGKLELISNLMDFQKISAEQAMDIVKIPVAEREFFRTRL